MALKPELEQELKLLKNKSRQVRNLSSSTKNKVLKNLATRLEKEIPKILAANEIDLKNLPHDTSTAFRDRLTLTVARIKGMGESLLKVAELPDPVGELIEKQTLRNGLVLKKVRAPLGIIFMIFESRPNVILEAFSLAFKSGNAIILRGGSDSKETSSVIYSLMRDELATESLADCALCGIQDYDRGIVDNLLKRKDLIDIVVPRGGEKLIDFVQRNSLMPIIKNDRGLCHTYVAEDADIDMAVNIITNAKTQRPGVCNSLETTLVNAKVAKDLLPKLYLATDSFSLEWRVDKDSFAILGGKPRVKLAEKKDWDTEYLDFIMNCRVVSSFDQALQHIETHGSKHSEAIVTSDEKKARLFQNEVDAAAVYWNASTRFTDGFEFGLGGELGISTQKLHVRGPVGLRELTTPRWIIDGTGQTR